MSRSNWPSSLYSSDVLPKCGFRRLDNNGGDGSPEDLLSVLLARDAEDVTAVLHENGGIDPDTTFETESLGAGDVIVEGASPAAFGVTSGVIHSSSLGVVKVSVDNLREVWRLAFRNNAARAEVGRKALSKAGWNLLPYCQQYCDD